MLPTLEACWGCARDLVSLRFVKLFTRSEKKIKKWKFFTAFFDLSLGFQVDATLRRTIET